MTGILPFVLTLMKSVSVDSKAITVNVGKMP